LKLLLDTHAWIWSTLEPERLSRRVSRALTDPDNELHLSPISVWEATLLARRGRLDLKTTPEAWIRAALAASPTALAEISYDVAVRAVELPDSVGRDPADRFLVATAMLQNLTLVTRDRRLRAFKTVPTLW